MLVALDEGAVSAFEGGIGINIDTVNRIDNFCESCKTDFYGVIDFNTKQILNGSLAHVNTVDARMGELVLGAGGAMKLNIIVARDGNEENFEVLRIDNGEDINVAASGFGNGAT